MISFPLISLLLIIGIFTLIIPKIKIKFSSQKNLGLTLLLLVIPICVVGVFALHKGGNLLHYTDPWLKNFGVPLAATKEAFHLGLFYSLSTFAILALLPLYEKNLTKQKEIFGPLLYIYVANLFLLFSDSGFMVLVMWICTFIPLYKYSKNSYKLAFFISSIFLSLAILFISVDGKYALSIAEYKMKIGPGTL